MVMIWSSQHNSGIGVIDEQHHELFQMVDRLRRMVQEGGSRGPTEALLADLVTCSEQHFATEEAFMSQFGYPDLDQHASEHQSMLASLRELRTMFLDGQHAMVPLVPTFLEGWLKHHISDGDFGFVTFLKAHNLI